MVEAYTVIDLELLKEQADATTTMPDKDLSEGAGSLLSHIATAIEEHGYVVIFAEKDDLPYQFRVRYIYQEANKETAND